MLRQLPTSLFSVPAFLFLSACASEPQAPNPGLKESFHTEIDASGSKRFTYALEMAMPEISGPYTANPNSRGGMMRADGMPKRGRGQPVDIKYALELKLQETQFCREGYFVIDRVVSQLGGEIRGECRDALER